MAKNKPTDCSTRLTQLLQYVVRMVYILGE